MVKNARSTSQQSTTAKTRLETQHASIDKRIVELGNRRALTDGEALELKQLKKKKLDAKDRISSIGGEDG